MIEKVNPSHPDKVADRIAGALVDYAYSKENDPRIAVEVLLGHGECLVIAETSVHIPDEFVGATVRRISKKTDVIVRYIEKPQDEHLAKNQEDGLSCGDNGIFLGKPLSREEKMASTLARKLYERFPTDGKLILDLDYENEVRYYQWGVGHGHLILCQSNAPEEEIEKYLKKQPIVALEKMYKEINPLGEWTGGIDVDSGATNRKLGSDMGHSVTGGGLHGKDLSKADVSVNIYAFLKAQETGEDVELCCAIGDRFVDDCSHSYGDIVEIAQNYINSVGGFEKFAEWGLV